MKSKSKNIIRRDFLKGLATVPFLGYFVLGFKGNIDEEISEKVKDYQSRLGIGEFEAPGERLMPPTGNSNNRLRFGLIGHGWRGEQLMSKLGYVNHYFIKKNTVDGKFNDTFKKYLALEDLNLEYAGVCDTFEIHARRGSEYVPLNNFRTGAEKSKTKPVKIYPTYREMITSDEIDMVVIATPDHTHTPMAIAAAKAGKHVYLEKPMTHNIEEAVELKKVIKSTGVMFQLGHENRQQMSYKLARELYQKGALGTVTMVETFTNNNSKNGAWIRQREFDHLGNSENINWKEFLGNAPWAEFDPKRYFNWHRYSDYGTGAIGNNFSHRYDCVNQILDIGIPETVVSLGGQYYYKNHGDMPDVMNTIFHYPERGMNMTWNCSLKNGQYHKAQIWGSEATMHVDREIVLHKEGNSKLYRDIRVGRSEPLYHYQANADVDAITTATSREYINSGYGPTFIDGKIIDATFLHVKEWVDAIRGQGKTSCDIDIGFEEAITYNMANLALAHQMVVRWDKENEKVIIG